MKTRVLAYIPARRLATKTTKNIRIKTSKETHYASLTPPGLMAASIWIRIKPSTFTSIPPRHQGVERCHHSRGMPSFKTTYGHLYSIHVYNTGNKYHMIPYEYTVAASIISFMYNINCGITVDRIKNDSFGYLSSLSWQAPFTH